MSEDETQQCQLCEPAPHPNCDRYTQVTIIDERTRESASVWVCLEHYEAIERAINTDTDR